MGKGTGAAAALVLATEAPEGAALVKLLRARVQDGDANLSDAPNSETATVYDAMHAPPVPLHDYLARWLTYAHSETHIIVIAAIYLDRMLEQEKLVLTSHNIHRVLISSLITAAKLCEDTPYGNHHYADVGGISVQEMNRMERSFLKDIGFNLYISPEDFQAARRHLCSGKERRRSSAGFWQPTVQQKLPPADTVSGRDVFTAVDQCCGVVTQFMW